MYQVSQLMSTPVANSSRPDIGLSGELSPKCIFPSFDFNFLDGDNSFECCSTDPLTGSHYVCRRSPRLLTNGYYIWTEDSFFCDPDGHITLNPSQTRVMYKENLVKIFRRKKRTHRSLSSLLDFRDSKSWLHESIFGDEDSPLSEDTWLEGIRSLGNDLDCTLSDGWESQKPITDTPEEKESSQNSSLQPSMKASGHFQKNILVHSKADVIHKVFFQALLLTVCLIISACARWFMGGELVSILSCALMFTIAYGVKSLFLSLASYFKATTYVKDFPFWGVVLPTMDWVFLLQLTVRTILYRHADLDNSFTEALFSNLTALDKYS